MTILNGFDVASYQTGMDVGDVMGDFVLVKATEGTDYTNPAFSGHAKQTLAAGKKLGIYHFIRNDSDIKQQADYFLSLTKPYIGQAMLVLDFENTTGSAIQNQAGVVLAKQWLDYIYQQTGVRPLLYTGISCENSLDWSTVVNANYGLWIAQYNNYDIVNGYQPRDLYGSLKHWRTAVMFQYTSTGRLPGWDGNLDFDVFYGDKVTWDKYATSDDKPIFHQANVTYALRLTNDRWLPAVTNQDGYAGLPSHAHDLLMVKVDHGSIRYQVHTAQSGWLGWVTGYDPSDLVNGCAGIPGQAIDAVQVYYETPPRETSQSAYYRVQTTDRDGWLPVVVDDQDYAGIFGEPIDHLQIDIDTHNPF